MHACIRVYIYISIYTYIHFSVFVQFRPLYFWIWVSVCFERWQSHQNLPQNLYHTTFGGAVSREKGGSAKDLASKPLGNPSICQVDDRLYRAPIDMPISKPTRIQGCSSIYRCLSSWNPRHDCLAYLLPWNTSHPGTRIEIERTPFSHVSVDN